MQTAYVIHRRHYGNTSYLIEVFSLEAGRYGVIAKGGQRKLSGFLQPFMPLLIHTVGRHELKSLASVECQGHLLALTGRRLYAGLYLNELLYRLLHRDEAHPTLFEHYEQALLELVEHSDVEIPLRRFERRLLAELGYGVSFEHDYLGRAIVADQWYEFKEEEGLIPYESSAITKTQPSLSCYQGEHLLLVSAEAFENALARRCAKLIMRQLLNSLLGSRPLYTRTLFQQPTSTESI